MSSHAPAVLLLALPCFGPLFAACGSDDEGRAAEPPGYFVDCSDMAPCQEDLVCEAPWGPRRRCTIACESNKECPTNSSCTTVGYCHRSLITDAD